MNILTHDNIDRVEWSRLVETSATGTWFQGPEAYSFYESLPELFKPFVVAVINDANGDNGDATLNGGALRGVCVGYVTVEKSVYKQFFTRRAIIIGGPVIANDATSEEVETLMKAVRDQFKIFDLRFLILNAPIYIECRNFNDYSRWKDAFASAGYEYKKHLNFHVDCRDKEAMWERLSESRKKQIRRSDATIEIIENKHKENLDKNEAEIREWYEILRELYRTKVKTPLWPVEFFLEIYRQSIGKYLMVKYEGKVIGGLLMVENEKCVYEWFGCGLNTEYKVQYPFVMATWSGMAYAAEYNIPRCDFMGAGEPNVPYGVRDFKEKFGGELVEHGRLLCVNKPLLYFVGKCGVWLLKRFK